MEEDRRKDVVVIGAGIVGTTTALVLQRHGCDVTLVDKGEPGMGCSYGNGGAISPDFCVPASLPGMLKRVPHWLMDKNGPLIIRPRHFLAVMPWLWRWVQAGRLDRVESSASALRSLHRSSIDLYKELLGGRAEGLIEKTGQIYVWSSDRPGPTEALARSLREKHGVETHPLKAQQIRELDPELAPIFTKGLFFPDNGHTVNPLRLVQTVLDLFIEAGGRFECASVSAFRRDGDQVNELCFNDGRTRKVSAVIVAAGMGSKRLASLLGDSVPLEAERGYHAMLPDPGIRPAIKISNRDFMFGLTPMEHGVRISGTVEFAPAGAPMNEARARGLLARAKDMYPRLNTEGATFWMGSRPSTPDSLPVIDHGRRARNVIYAFGHGHTGLTGAPMTANLVHRLLTVQTPDIDLMPYRLGRF